MVQRQSSEAGRHLRAAAVQEVRVQRPQAPPRLRAHHHDLRRIAKRRTPAAAFDYTDGAADDELSLRRARQAFEDIEFHPSILRDVSDVDTTARILGGASALPFGSRPPASRG